MPVTNITYSDNSSESFSYDAAGNRTFMNGVAYVYDAANRLLQAGSKVYTYDQNGNRITEDAKQYQYDWGNRLTSITNGDETTNFTYDGEGSRTSQAKIVSGATIEASSYFYDPSQGIPRLLQEEIVSGPSLSYVYAGRLLEQTGGPGGNMFYHQNAIGNTLAMTDMTGVTVNTYRYDAFGASELISGTTPNNRQFTGHVSDNTGLIYMNARYYDPATGRFLTQDTVPGRPMDPLSYNLYAYCKNNPVAYTDPSGNWRSCVHYTMTLQWAQELGFSWYDAYLIALAVNAVDIEHMGCFLDSTGPWEDDKLHFDMNPGIGDSRIEAYYEYMDKAVGRWNGADNAYNERISSSEYPWEAESETAFAAEERYESRMKAIGDLGIAIHALQDIDAHGSVTTMAQHDSVQYPPGGTGCEDDNFPIKETAIDNPYYDVDWDTWQAYEGNERISATEQKTKYALLSFLEQIY